MNVMNELRITYSINLQDPPIKNPGYANGQRQFGLYAGPESDIAGLFRSCIALQQLHSSVGYGHVE